jgi:hypothetical protein
MLHDSARRRIEWPLRGVVRDRFGNGCSSGGKGGAEFLNQEVNGKPTRVGFPSFTNVPLGR